MTFTKWLMMTNSTFKLNCASVIFVYLEVQINQKQKLLIVITQQDYGSVQIKQASLQHLCFTS